MGSIEKTKSAQLSSKADVDTFLTKVKTMAVQKTGNGRGRLVFAMDATMSRQPSWDRALSIQGEMFLEAGKVGSLDVQLVYFRGMNECRSSKWVDNAKKLANMMTKVSCQGGNTQIGRVLSHVKAEAGAGAVNAVVYVGDAMEENVDHLCKLAGEIGMLKVPLFMFQDGNDTTTEVAFREMARLSRGAYFKLDANSAKLMGELLGAVAAYAAGGKAALTNKSGASKLLLEQLKS